LLNKNNKIIGFIFGLLVGYLLWEVKNKNKNKIMEKFFLTLMHSWGSDTPQEVFWGLNDLITWAKTKGFDNKGLWFDDPIEVDVKNQEQIGQLIHDYSEEVEWDESLGTLTINGSKHLPYNKQIWFPPTIKNNEQLIKDLLEFFENKLK
jgi:hypothetical protein